MAALPKANFQSTVAWAEGLVAGMARMPDALSEGDLAVLKSQLALFSTTAINATPPCEATVTIIRCGTDLTRLGQALAHEPVVSIDLETSSLDHRAGEIVGVGFATAAASYYVPTGHRNELTNALLPDQQVVADVAQAVGLSRLPLLAHNAKFELKWLRHHAGQAPRFIWDTMIAARLLRPDLPAGLKETAVRELDVPDWGMAKQELERVQFLPIERVGAYCAKDVRYTLKLYEKQTTCLA